MSKHLHFSPAYRENASELHMSIDRHGDAQVDIDVSIEDVCVLLDDMLSDWYALSKEQRSKLLEFFHDEITYEE